MISCGGLNSGKEHGEGRRFEECELSLSNSRRSNKTEVWQNLELNNFFIWHQTTWFRPSQAGCKSTEAEKLLKQIIKKNFSCTLLHLCQSLSEIMNISPSL